MEVFNFKVVSLNHEKAPVEIREQMYLAPDQMHSFPLKVQEILGLEEFIVISTCNRTEIYYLSDADHSEALAKILCIEKGLIDTSQYLPYFHSITSHEEAVRNLFEVSMGMQSKVIGDIQISNQIKQSYSIASELKLAGPFLHRLLHTIFHTHKRVNQETPYRDGAASVSYSAAELASDLVKFHSAPSALVVGLGEMGRDVVRNLAAKSFGRLAICNRSLDKAQALADELNIECIPYEELHNTLAEFDVIVTALTAPSPLLTKQSFEKVDKPVQKFLIDLSVPRAISADTAAIPGVLLFDIDEITQKTDEVLQKRLAAVPQVKKIIETEMGNFLNWSRELSISPTIQRLKEALEQIRKEELSRYLKKADAETAKILDDATKSMMHKIIKLPVLQLKDACKRGEQENMIGLLSDIFDLETQPKKV